jgi:hypothetical protein
MRNQSPHPFAKERGKDGGPYPTSRKGREGGDGTLPHVIQKPRATRAFTLLQVLTKYFLLGP